VKNKTSVLATITIIIVVLAAVGGISWYIISNKQASSPPTTSKNLFTNPNGKYSFECPSVWQVAINQYNTNNSLFGPGATSASGTGGVEIFNQQTSIDNFLNGIAANFIDKKDITIDGVSGTYTRYKGTPISGVQAVLLKNGKIYNIYINSEKREDIELFDQIISTFKFLD